MSQYQREHPDEPVRHDWLAGETRSGEVKFSWQCSMCGGTGAMERLAMRLDQDGNEREYTELMPCEQCGGTGEFNASMPSAEGQGERQP